MAKKLEQSLNQSLELNFDDPTVEETQLHQEMADEIYIIQKYRYDFADIQLRQATKCKNLSQKIAWLKKPELEYEGVNIPNNSKSVSFSEAIKLGYSRNIYAMFNTEIKSLKKIK